LASSAGYPDPQFGRRAWRDEQSNVTRAQRELSGGEQQRVAVARALAGDPSILLADEPTGNLDTRNGEGVMELLGELNECGSTIIMVTHDQRFAKQAKRTIGLLDGQLVEERIAASAS
jgi:putative ABC transport system ATP-binding protein